MLFKVLKLFGFTVIVLLLILVIGITAILLFENNNFSDIDGIEKREFSCYRGELEIRGTVFMPIDNNNLPIAVVCHEFMINRLFSYPYAMMLGSKEVVKAS